MKKVLGILKIYGILLCGASIAALGVGLFLSPADTVAGGLSGIGIMVHALWGFPIGITMLLLNIPLFLLGFKSMGAKFLVRSLFGAIMFSLLTDAAMLLQPITENLLLSALFGGGLLGIGMGLLFLFGITTGGTDIAAQLLHKTSPRLDVGKWLLVVDGLIIAASGFVFKNVEGCLYGVIAAIINSMLIDMMLQGANFAKVVYVISNCSDTIAKRVMQQLERGVTGIYCRGMYLEADATMLMCVIKKHEIPRFEKIVLSEDPKAFIIFTGARSVSGEGFKVYPIN